MAERIGAIATATAVAMLSIWPAESSATPNPCGTTIVADTTLSGDLHCPAGNGIVIGAPGITFDLGGHTLSGTLTGVGVLNDGHANVTVTNGAVVGFANGVQLNGTTANVVQGVSTSGNGAAGILLAAADGNRIEGNSLLCNGLVGPQPGCVSGQRPEGGFGVLVATDVNGDGSDGNLVQGNVVVSTENGIVLDQSNENRILANATSKTAGGMVVAVGSARNQVIGNVTTESLSGIFVTAEDNLDNLIAANVANNNGSAGIAIATGGNRTILWANVTDLNFQGIDVRAVATTIAANSANRNTSLGINAIAGVVDGGGNTASGNGDPRQCVGVVCAPSDRPPSDLVPVDPQLPAAGAALPVRATVAFTG